MISRCDVCTGLPQQDSAFWRRSLICATGPQLASLPKREGDGASLRGLHAAMRVLRATGWPARYAVARCGPWLELGWWCDYPHDCALQSLINAALAGQYEALVRDDQLINGLLVLDQNIHRAGPGGGSAIFFPALPRRLLPRTEGCIAVSHATMNQRSALRAWFKKNANALGTLLGFSEQVENDGSGGYEDDLSN